MAGEERLVDGNVLDPDDALRLQFENAVHQEHREAVREDLTDLFNVQDRHGESLL